MHPQIHASRVETPVVPPLSCSSDPMKVIDAHGADALRLYLINSPVVRAESLKFKEEGVQATVREVLLPWFNAFRFFVQQVRR